ncbi:hypothetical protein DL766_001715 [Monosporascus sp. MC13-8B]|uniref:Dockerin type 1 n=1 Tax=Monosporascus cannonballus TaxID=155416 RepID=A0ABY0H8L0_9PEZI|nr:hypothetical protein DL763_009585 [Monosporascus cannonballus]RYO85291.1 hypothetical protein DL762_005244 [Monosporascus cannonballus]RYP36958.1 hypothetical protein DL766_001715 [Monosporascus sp. MC13-8B]
MTFTRAATAATLLHAIGCAAVPVAQAASRTVAAAAPPATFSANPNIGPGGNNFKDSAHFRVYGAPPAGTADAALNMLEAAYSCFVDTLGWRSTGLSFNDDADDGPWTKVNLYSVESLPGAAGVMHSDFKTGMSWLEVQHRYTSVPGVTVHEYGHGLTYHERTWVDQARTGAWWETVANWVADTHKTSELCADARSRFGQPTGATEINLHKVIGDSFQVLVDGTAGSGNYYEAWPFLAYLTANPDEFEGLGRDTVRELFRQYQRNSNETPLHTLDRLLAASSATAQQVVGRYWARMAYVDIGHPTAQQVFLQQRGNINYANLDPQGSDTWRVKSTRRPRYMGANIVPLRTSGSSTTVNVRVNANGGGAFTATLAVRDTRSGATRYVDLPNGSGSTTVAGGEEVSLVVANTPALIQYDPFKLGSDVQTGLDYTVTISGATA